MNRTVLLLGALALATAMPARAVDPFNTAADVPPPPDLGVVMSTGAGVEAACPSGVPGGTVGLAEVVARALCHDPRTRQSWAEARAQAAQVGTELANTLPSVSATIELSRERLRTREDGRRTVDAATTDGAALEFSWPLFDFGQTDAVLDSARKTLMAATASHDAAMQEVFVDASDAYFEVLSAQSAVEITGEVEQFNARMVSETDKLLKKKEITRADQLQAQTALAQATLDRGRAEGELRIAQGQLASLLGHGPAVPLRVDAGNTQPPDVDFVQSIHDLLLQAQQAHPEIRAAQQRFEAARANVSVAQRAYRPTLSLVYGNQRFKEPTRARVHENKISLQLSIPLFDGFSREYAKRAALAERDAALAGVSEARQKVSLDVWEAYHGFNTEAQAALDAGRLFDVASQLLQAEQKRFGEGDGDMLDLLDAQGARAEAALERTQSNARSRAARLRLAAGLGRLGFWALRRP